MTRAEFMQKVESLKESSTREGIWILGFLAIFVLGLVGINNYPGKLPENIRGLVFIFTLFGGLWGIIAFFGNKAKRHRRQLGLVCPNCKKDFVGTSVQIIIASGRCGNCGAFVLEDWNR
jgi:hypothetical protein